MTDDVVARLRRGWSAHELSRHFDEDTLLEAAGEIERLREALQNIVYADGDYNLLQDIARAALSPPAKGDEP
jgi:hypothetical protein